MNLIETGLGIAQCSQTASLSTLLFLKLNLKLDWSLSTSNMRVVENWIAMGIEVAKEHWELQRRSQSSSELTWNKLEVN